MIGKKSNRLLVPVNPFIIIERLAISLLCGQVANINYAEHMLPPGGGINSLLENTTENINSILENTTENINSLLESTTESINSLHLD